MVDNLKSIREALETAVPAALNEIGMEQFKKMSFFMSNSPDLKVEDDE